MAKHPLFKYLYGNPTSLVQAANCYLHNAKQRESGKLTEIYQMLDKRITMLSQKNESNFHLYLKSPENQNNFSLEIATRMTLSLLPEDSGAKDLLFFLGCLPGGITDEFLK